MATKPRVLAEFDTDIPDDTVQEGVSIVWYGGEPVAIAIQELLRRPDRQVTGLEYAAERGWRFIVRTRRRAFFFQVQFIQQVLLVTDDITYPEIFGKPNLKHLSEVLVQLNEDMRSDGRFHNIKWCFEGELFGEGPGAPSPVA